MEEEKNVMYEVKTYTDKRGFEVRELAPIEEATLIGTDVGWSVCNENINKMFFGMAHVLLPTGNPDHPQAQHAVQVNFPKTIKTKEEAFNIMEDEVNKELSRQVEEAKAKAEAIKRAKSKEIITPENNGKRLVIPFPVQNPNQE